MLDTPQIVARVVSFEGDLQGKGIRPLIARLARESKISGGVRNTSTGIDLVTEGQSEHSIAHFLDTVRNVLRKQNIHFVENISISQSVGLTEFQIYRSEEKALLRGDIPKDVGICVECTKELFAPQNRRYRYPFISCATCGPRYTILRAMPFDRERTSYSKYAMCAPCRSEYESPENRRYHSQTIACPDCGPELLYRDNVGDLVKREEALAFAAEALLSGKILAVKSVGGYQLICRADDEATVKRLRERKFRRTKPFAVLFPNVESVRGLATLTDAEAEVLQSIGRPIVILKKRKSLVDSITCGLTTLGAMLPSSGLQMLLLESVRVPLIVTSGNVSTLPMEFEDASAFRSLASVADGFLLHHLPIENPVDDTVLRDLAGRFIPLRLGRGYGPVRFSTSRTVDEGMLAYGADLKASVSIGTAKGISVSPYLGEVSSLQSIEDFSRKKHRMENLLNVSSRQYASDTHPKYFTSQLAKSTTSSLAQIPHHLAHAMALVLDTEIAPDACIFTWDGTGWGTEGELWGGETLSIEPNAWMRVASIRPFRLPGGESSIRRVDRIAASLCFASDCDTKRDEDLNRLINSESLSPNCTSLGRLFDGVSALVGACEDATYEGEAAIRLEELAQAAADSLSPYPLVIEKKTLHWIWDWRPMVREICQDRKNDVDPSEIAIRFHHTLVEWIVTVAKEQGKRMVGLTGGCFQNQVLSTLATKALTETGFDPILHQRLPPNDGSISAGQLAAFYQYGGDCVSRDTR